MREKIIELNADYAAAIDDGRLEDWPSFFTEDCVGLPRLRESDGSSAVVETGFAVLRTMRTGETAVFASGRYLDRIVHEGGNSLRFSRRDVVCDSHRIDTLLALPL